LTAASNIIGAPRRYLLQQVLQQVLADIAPPQCFTRLARRRIAGFDAPRPLFHSACPSTPSDGA
jgi:hypothetical protein